MKRQDVLEDHFPGRIVVGFKKFIEVFYEGDIQPDLIYCKVLN